MWIRCRALVAYHINGIIMNLSLQWILLAIAVFVSLKHEVNSKCSKNCVHFQGASYGMNIGPENAFCKEGQHNGKDYYMGHGESRYLYFSFKLKAWVVARSLGDHMQAVVFDRADDPTDISSTWRHGSLTSYGSAHDYMYADHVISIDDAKPDKDVKVKCGKYDNTGVIVGATLGAVLGPILVGIVIAFCCMKRKNERISGPLRFCIALCHVCCRRNNQQRQSVQRQVIVRNSSENVLCSNASASGRQARYQAGLHSNPVLPPAYEDATSARTQNNNSSTITVASTCSPSDATAGVTACQPVAANGSELLTAGYPSDETAKNTATSASAGRSLQPLATHQGCSEAEEHETEGTIIAVGVSGNTETGASTSDRQLLYTA